MSEKKPPPPKQKPRGHRPWFAFRRIDLEHEIDTIRSYIETVINALEREFQKYTAQLKKQMEEVDDETMQQIGEAYAEEKGYLVNHFPEFTLQNAFMATYSLLEDELFKIARQTGKYLQIKLEPDELGDRGIRAAKTFLEKLCDVTIPNDQVWQTAVRHGQLRNVFAHARGHVKPTNIEIRQYVASQKNISIDSKDQLRITQDFCFEVLENVRLLLRNLLKLAGTRELKYRYPD
jgi:hypothetical protein